MARILTIYVAFWSWAANAQAAQADEMRILYSSEQPIEHHGYF